VHFTKNEIDRIADRLLSTDASNERRIVVDLLYQYVALTEETLFHLVRERVAISESLRSFSVLMGRYRKDGLLVNLLDTTLQMARRAGLPGSGEGHRQRAYRLGPVGEELARRYGWSEDKPLIGVTEQRVGHDLICAEAMLKMQQLYLAEGAQLEVWGPRQALVWDPEKKAAVIAPDGLLIKHSPDGSVERAFAVELQNTKSRREAGRKITRYEKLAGKELGWVWSDVWELPQAPVVLVIHRHDGTLTHFEEGLYALSQQQQAKYTSLDLGELWGCTARPPLPPIKPRQPGQGRANS
jgi:hypothetical protein